MDKEARIQTFSIQTNLTAPQVMERLKRFTIEEYQETGKNREHKYYGTIADMTFHLCNTKYGPYSSGPWIKGEVRKLDDKTVVTFETDIEERLDIITKILSPFLVVFGLLAVISGVTMPEYREIFVAVGAGLLACPFAYAAFARRLLTSMQRDEVERFRQLVTGSRANFKHSTLKEVALVKR